MSTFDAFRFDGKRALVVGGATGMGAAAAEVIKDAGAEVVNMDFAEIRQDGVTKIHVNLAEQASIDTALEQVDKADVILSCAGVADGTPDIEKINFVGHRYLIDQMLASDKIGRGGAIGMISSAGGLGWEADLEELKVLLANHDWDSSVQWIQDKGWADYLHMKRAMCAYVAAAGYAMWKQGIRINAICPGPTDTPLAQANKETWLGFGADYRTEVGSKASTPLEQAYVLVNLCSDAAMAINGQVVVSDQGYLAAGLTDAFPDAASAAKFLYGRMG